MSHLFRFGFRISQPFSGISRPLLCHQADAEPSALRQVNGLTIGLCGDLKHGRTVHSLAQLLSLYDIKLRLVAPAGLEMPAALVQELRDKGVKLSEHQDVHDVISDVDVLYVTRVQKERFANQADYDKLRAAYTVTPRTLTRAKSNMILMHPLPRVGEIDEGCDLDPRSVYFRQVEHAPPPPPSLPY
jgi:aspartate carbamoyltransferase catalytic subunit